MWDLRPALLRAGVHGGKVLRFTTVSNPGLRLAAKEYLYARLTGTVRGGRVLRPVAATRVYGHSLLVTDQTSPFGLNSTFL